MGCQSGNNKSNNLSTVENLNDWSHKNFDIYKSKMYEDVQVYVGRFINKDTFNINDTLKLKFYLTDSSFKKLAAFHSLNYHKTFSYYLKNESLSNEIPAYTRGPDTGYVEFKISNSHFGLNKFTVGISSIWENKVKDWYDTVFLQEVEYYVKK